MKGLKRLKITDYICFKDEQKEKRVRVGTQQKKQKRIREKKVIVKRRRKSIRQQKSAVR